MLIYVYEVNLPVLPVYYLMYRILLTDIWEIFTYIVSDYLFGIITKYTTNILNYQHKYNNLELVSYLYSDHIRWFKAAGII